VSSSVKPIPASPAGTDAGSSPAGPDASLVASAPQLSAVEIARAARRRRAQRLLRNLLIWVGGPTLAGIVYFGFLASDQYESFATLSVPGAHNVVLREFMLSRDMLSALESQAKFSEHYKGAHDPLAGLSLSAGSEDRYRNFHDKVDVRVEQSGILRLRVRAFAGADAQHFARLVVAQLEAFWAQKPLDASAKIIVVSQPSQASQATYPRRFYGVLTVALVSLALYAIGSLLVAAAREHAQF
jgi:capsule polysaccharide export protein KpsE/RkpR